MKILFLGETYTASHTYYRGADYVTLPEYANTGAAFAEMLRSQGFVVTHLASHEVAALCPVTREGFAEYDAVILSDVGSNTMLTQTGIGPGEKRTNRLEELRAYIKAGGGLLMCGGYFGFSGIQNTARYGMTPLAEALPVEILNYDDRVECPEGVSPRVALAGHPVLRGVNLGECPFFCGYNKVMLKEGAQLLAMFYDDPFLACMEYGKGRSFAFTSDCEPNWATLAFLRWEGYPRLFRNIMNWVGKR